MSDTKFHCLIVTYISKLFGLFSSDNFLLVLFFLNPKVGFIWWTFPYNFTFSWSHSFRKCVLCASPCLCWAGAGHKETNKAASIMGPAGVGIQDIFSGNCVSPFHSHGGRFVRHCFFNLPTIWLQSIGWNHKEEDGGGGAQKSDTKLAISFHKSSLNSYFPKNSLIWRDSSVGSI